MADEKQSCASQRQYKKYGMTPVVYCYIDASLSKHCKNQTNKALRIEPHIAVLNIFESDDRFKVTPELTDVFKLPDIYIWDPKIQFGFNINCPQCNNVTCIFIFFVIQQNASIYIILQTLLSTYTHHKGDKPRIVLQLNGIALLISTKYNCRNKHCKFTYYTSSSSKYMDLLPKEISGQFPVFLTAKSCLTIELYEMVVKAINSKQRIKTFDKMVSQLCESKFADQKNTYCDYWMARNFPLSSQLVEKLFGRFDTEKISEKHRFLYAELVKYDYAQKNNYFNYLASIQTHSQTITADHTFAVGRKIALLFQERYSKPFNGLYIIMDPTNKRILALKLAESTAWEYVKDSHEYVEKMGVCKDIITDLCCDEENQMLGVHKQGRLKFCDDIFYLFGKILYYTRK